MAENICRTVYGSALQTAKQLGLPYDVKANSTLNEKFGILSSVSLASDDIPNMRYFVIGNGGHQMTIGANNIAKPEPIQHLATDAALYNQIPFVLREPENDLSPSERLKYALRRSETHQGRPYYAYYLRRLDLTGVTVNMEKVTVTDGVSNTVAFIPDSSNLNPTPPPLDNSGVNVVSGDYVTATARVGLVFTEADINELLNVAEVLYEDDDYAIISEIGLCSGLDKLVTATGANNTSFNFQEAIAVQVVSHINTFLQLKFTNTGTTVLLDVGATEPLFSIV